MKLVLASGSPRRRELLDMIGIEGYTIMPDTCDEEIVPGLPPGPTVCGIALKKAKNVSLLCCEDDIILAADTLVFIDGCLLGKPRGAEDAAGMLRRLSGRKHTVYTGVAIVRGDVYMTGAEMTDVYFRDITENEIAAYVSTGEPMDKAGAYGAQGRAAIFIERVDGDFFNVMGLPLCRLSTMLRNFGI